MGYTSDQLFATKQYAILYSLLCRTNELDNKFTRSFIEKKPTVKGFKNFIKKLQSFLDLKTYFERESFLNLIKPDCISQKALDLYFSSIFSTIKRIRMSNKFHSRLNASKAIGQNNDGQGFNPVEGWKTIKLLNIAGLFNMNDLIFNPKPRDVDAFNWYLNNPNRILLDNGAFNANYTQQQFQKIIQLYQDFEEKVKSLKYTHSPLPQQRGIILSDLYSKIAVVGPDKPQDAAETIRLLKMYGDIINKMIAQTDIMFAVQTTRFYDEESQIRHDIPDAQITELIDIVSKFGKRLIIALPSTKGFQRTRNRQTIPFIVSQCEDKVLSFMDPEVYQITMNNILSYCESPLKINLPVNENGEVKPYKVIRFHLLGSSFGMMYMQMLFNVCVSNFLVKEMNMRCTRPDENHIKIFSNLTYRDKFMILGEEYHPEVFRHLVSCDSSSWIGAVSEKGNIFNPLTGRQMELIKDPNKNNKKSLTHFSNKEIKINLALISSKIAESRYYDCSWETASGDRTLKDIEKSINKIEMEVRIIRNNKEEQKAIREKFVQDLMSKTNAWIKQP